MMQQMKQWGAMRPWVVKGALVVVALASLVAFLSLGIGAYAQALTPHRQATTSGWTISHDATGGALGNTLTASATIAANDAWVGGQNFAGRTEVTLFEHWNGTKWSIVGSPNPGNEGNQITAMAADRSTDVWAVGYYANINTNGNQYPLVEHWNGVRWYNIFSPIPPHGIGTSLTGVASLSATDAWITGIYRVQGGASSIPFIEHWNGTRWSFVAIPGLGYSYNLNALKGISGSNVWAVGSQSPSGNNQPFSMHWDGVRWSVVPMASVGIRSSLSGIVAITSTNIWAVGSEFLGSTGLYRTLAEHWNGSSWQIVYTPTINSTEEAFFTGVAATSSNTVWAVGFIIPGSESTASSPFVDEWNGTNWTAVPIPVGPSNSISARLLGVSATPQGGVWAVGLLRPLNAQNDATLILRHS